MPPTGSTAERGHHLNWRPATRRVPAWHHAGGTCAPIQAACAGPTTLVGGDGSIKDCSPYLCVAGACHSSCASSSECVGGRICDVAQKLRTPAPTVPEGSGRCALAGSTRAPAALAAPAAVLLLALARSRRTRRVVRVH